MTMKLMNEKEIERWTRIRARGLQRFIAIETVAYALIPVFATMVWYALKYGWTGKIESSTTDYIRDIFLPVVFGLWGFFRGHLRWIKQEDRYLASVESVERT